MAEAAKKSGPEYYPIFCSAPGKKGTTTFELDLPDGKHLVWGVELNKTVMVPKWVYAIWQGSYWNENRSVSREMEKAISHIQDKDE